MGGMPTTIGWDKDYQWVGCQLPLGGIKLALFVSETPRPTRFISYNPTPYSLQEEGRGRQRVRLPLGRPHPACIFHWHN